MGLHKKEKKMYLNVTAGKIRRNVEAGYENAEIRETTNPSTGKPLIKYELEYDVLDGYITFIDIVSNKYGDFLHITIEDGPEVYYLSMNLDSRYAEDFLKRLRGVNFHKPVSIEPYQFKDKNDKMKSGVVIKQDGKKIHNFYLEYDKETSSYTYLYGCPPFKPEYLENKSDMKIYSAEIAKFLRVELEKEIIPQIQKANEEVQNTADLADDDLNDTFEDDELEKEKEQDPQSKLTDEVEDDLPF